MPNFPDPVAIPENVPLERFDRKKHIYRSLKWGILIRSSLILAEFIGVYFFHSSALFLDALASSMDVFCSLMLLFFVRLAEKPPDKNHPFGHGRLEPLAGLQLALLLVVVGIGMLAYQSYSIEYSSVETLNTKTWIIPFAAMILLEICYRFTMRAAKKHKSTALESEALHYRVDGLTSLFATVALVLSVFLPTWTNLIDHVGALLIAGFMIVLGSRAFLDNLNQLIDKIPDEEFFVRVRQATLKVVGVKETEKIRIQQYGPDAHVDIDVEVDPELSVKLAHEISQKVRRAIQKDWPAVRDVIVHIEPYYPNDHLNIIKGDSRDV